MARLNLWAPPASRCGSLRHRGFSWAGGAFGGLAGGYGGSAGALPAAAGGGDAAEAGAAEGAAGAAEGAGIGAIAEESRSTGAGRLGPSHWDAMASRNARKDRQRAARRAHRPAGLRLRLRAGRDARESAELTAGLISSACDQCGARPGQGCLAAAYGRAEYLRIRTHPDRFVHASRMLAAIDAGAVAREDVAAQFPASTRPAWL